MGNLARKVVTYSGLVLVLVLASSVVSVAEITEIHVGLEGAMCAHCATVLENVLSRLEGVEEVTITQEPAQATIVPKAGCRLDVEKLRRAVAKAEFVATWIRFEAVGLLTLREGTPGLKVQGTDQVIPLESDSKLEDLLQTVRQNCELVFIVGLIPQGQWTARIERFEVRGLLSHPC
jgi:copper chaperone CopZ